MDAIEKKMRQKPCADHAHPEMAEAKTKTTAD
jgi:hypothetical protein